MPRHLWTASEAKAFASAGARAKNAKCKLAKEAAIEPPPLPPDEYVASQLSRTRKQIDLLNARLESPGVDWKEVKALSDAKARLYDIEAALAGRPKPGQLRPASPRANGAQRRPAMPTGYVQEHAQPASPGQAPTTEHPSSSLDSAGL